MAADGNRETPGGDENGSKAKRRDPLFGAKLDHIEGVVGYLFPNGHFSNSKLANALGVATDEQMSRKRNGGVPVSNQELSRLIAYCALDGLAVDDLRAGVAELDAALRREGIGLHGSLDGDRLRRKWLGDPNRRSGKVVIKRVTARRAGLGAPVETSAEVPHLQVGAQVRLVFTVPADGHVLVLSDEYLRRDITCLAPSCYAPTTRVRAGSVGIPFIGPEIEPALTVLGPPGWCRIIVLWTSRDLGLEEMPDRASKRTPFEVQPRLLAEIERALDLLAAQRQSYAILTGEYRVVE